MNELLDQEQAAAVLGVSKSTMAFWRLNNKGPAFVRFGRAVRYRPEDIEAYIQAQTIDPKRQKP